MNSEQLCDLVIDALEEVKAKDIVKLDVRELTTVTDYMIVASGTSNRPRESAGGSPLPKHRARRVIVRPVSKARMAVNGCSWIWEMRWCM